jgi:hypothetical protein
MGIFYKTQLPKAHFFSPFFSSTSTLFQVTEPSRERQSPDWRPAGTCFDPSTLAFPDFPPALSRPFVELLAGWSVSVSKHRPGAGQEAFRHDQQKTEFLW